MFLQSVRNSLRIWNENDSVEPSKKQEMEEPKDSFACKPRKSFFLVINKSWLDETFNLIFYSEFVMGVFHILLQELIFLALERLTSLRLIWEILIHRKSSKLDNLNVIDARWIRWLVHELIVSEDLVSWMRVHSFIISFKSVSSISCSPFVMIIDNCEFNNWCLLS